MMYLGVLAMCRGSIVHASNTGIQKKVIGISVKRAAPLIPVSSGLEGFAALVWRYTSFSSFQLPNIEILFTIGSSKAPNEDV